jgi:D-alanyl-D-alanine dipeptidase
MKSPIVLAIMLALAPVATAFAKAPTGLRAPPENAALAALVGEYAEGEHVLTVREDHGQLYALRDHRPDQRLAPAQFRARHGAPLALRLDGAVYRRTDIGMTRLAQIRASVTGSAAKLRAAALAAQPPAEPPARAKSDLVDLTTVDPTIRLDIRYATSDTILGMPLYEKPMAFLQRPAAEALARANKALAAHGYGLLIHDGYRPWYVTKMFWDATLPEEHIFVADPAEGSRHNRGCAVDLTLYDLKTGKALVMTGGYDEMSPRSFADYKGGTTRQRWLRDLLRRTMEAQGFAVYDDEWWHFDYRTWADYAIGNASFTDLSRQAPTGGPMR